MCSKCVELHKAQPRLSSRGHENEHTRTLPPAICGLISLFGWILLADGPAAQTQPGLAASPWAEQHASRVRLVAARARMPQGHYLAGLEIVLDDGWKTYWRNPGDGGVPPSFDWAGSANVAAIKVLYPAPMRLPEANGISIGYKHAVLLPIEVTPQDPAKPIALKLALEFGVCRDICIPATATLDIAIPPGPKGAPPPELVAALERVPRPQQSRRKDDPELKRIAIGREAGSPRLTIEAAFDQGREGLRRSLSRRRKGFMFLCRSGFRPPMHPACSASSRTSATTSPPISRARRSPLRSSARPVPAKPSGPFPEPGGMLRPCASPHARASLLGRLPHVAAPWPNADERR